MLATLVQQWARRYLRVTQPPQFSPHGCARIRAFYSDGVEKFHLSRAVEALPTLIHLSLFLFFVGLLIYLFNINHFVFLAIVWWVGVSSLAYLAITFMPAWWPQCPYYTPITSIVGLLRRVEKVIKKTIPNEASEIDGHILKWTFDTLAEDHELEMFFEKIPGFCNSKVVKNPQHLAKLGRAKLSSSLIGFLSRTSSSNSLSEEDKKGRFIICVKAAEVAAKVAGYSSPIWHILQTTFCGKWNSMLRSVETADSLKGTDDGTSLFLQSLASGIIANVRDRDDHWVALAADQLHKSENTIRGYCEHDEGSVLLANLTHITRQIVHFLGPGDKDKHGVAKAASKYMFPSLSKFGIQDTVPDLRRDFLELWDEIDQKAQNDRVISEIRDNLRHLRDALSQNTNDASTLSTPSDTSVPGHPSDSFPPVHEAIDGNTQTYTAITSPPGSCHDPSLATAPPHRCRF